MRTALAASLRQPARGQGWLAKIVEADGGHDDAENGYYEAAADPLALQNERARRRCRGSYIRRLRRLDSRSRDATPTSE